MKHLIALWVVLVLLASCQSNTVHLFTRKKSDLQLKGISDHTYLNIDELTLIRLKQNKDQKVSIEVPYKDKVLVLDLIKMDLFSPGFEINTSPEHDKVVYNQGLYYTGSVRGEDTSFVNINILGGEINGVISTKKLGNLNIGKSAPSEYVVSVQSVSDSIKFNCNENGITNPELDSLRKAAEGQIINQVKLKAVGIPCLSIDYELTYSVFSHFSSVQASIDWATGIIAGCKALILKENINLQIASFYVHQTPDGYSASTDVALNEFRTKRFGDVAFKGNFHQLIRGMPGGSLSGIAYVAVTCVPQYAFSVAETIFPYNTFAAGTIPTYSWPYEVITHELGHNMGSEHTQSCSWPGGAIDGCVTQEGNCAQGPIPPFGGGTIMSYCHLTSVGINFANGFGPLPGDKIREYSAKACYTSSCTVNPNPNPCSTNIPPVISINSPSASYVRGSMFVLNASVTDDGTITRVDFYNEGTQLMATDISYPYTVNIGPAYTIKYAITAKATDNCGAVTTSAPITVVTTTACNDGYMNGNETNIDCGGSCPPCATPSLNLALNKTSTQSTLYSGGGNFPASNGNDGNKSTFSHTNQEPNPWYNIDLGATYDLKLLKFTNRIDCCGFRIHEFKMFVTNVPVTDYNTPNPVYSYKGAPLTNGQVIPMPVRVTGRYVTMIVQNLQAGDFLSVAELEAYSDGVTCITYKVANPITYRDSIVCK